MSKVTAEEFINDNKPYIEHVIKYNRIIKENVGYDEEDVYGEIYLAICEVFHEKGGEMEYPLSDTDIYDLSSAINRRLGNLKKFEFIVSVPPCYAHSESERNKLSKESANAVYWATKPYIPLDLSSGTEANALSMDDKAVSLETRLPKIVYTTSDFAGEDTALERVLYETFGGGDDTDDNILSFVESLSPEVKNALALWALGFTQKEAEEKAGLREKYLRDLQKKALKYIQR